jgi:site-specific recombinase XerD
MASKIDTPAKRNKLPIAKKPVWERLAPGVFLGYRKSPEARKWLVRYHDPDAPKGSTNPYKMQVFANADDAHIAEEALSFKHASVEALRLAEAASVPGAKDALPLTVRRAVEEYIAVRNARERKIRGRDDIRSDADTRLSRNVLSDAELCDTKLKDATKDRLTEWLAGVPLKAATKKRLAGDFKAALRLAGERYSKSLPATWRTEISAALTVKNDERNSRAIQVLPDDQIRAALLAAKEVDEEGNWGGDLYRLMTALAATGARFSQAVRIIRKDAFKQRRVNRKTGAEATDCVVMVPASRKGKGGKGKPPTKRIITASDFEILTSGPDTDPDGPLLMRWKNEEISPTVWKRGERAAWYHASEITRPWRLIVERAGLPAHTVPYAFRHSSIVRQLQAGLPVALVAALHDTSPLMIQEHYGAYIVDASDDMIAAATVSVSAE